jgi:sugar phosphate isomerase/epimerase
MTLPLSCADFTFPLLNHEDACRLISILGLKGVDIGFFAGRSHIRPEDVRGRESAAGSEIKARLSDLGLKASDVFFQPGENLSQRAVNHPAKNERDEGWEMFRRAVDFALATGTRHIGGLPGMGFDRSDDLQIAAEESSHRAALALEAGLVYGVEPHVGSIIPTPEKTLEFLKMAPGVKLILDYGHFIHAGFSNEDAHPLLAHASHFHARGGAKGRLQTPVSENDIDFPEINRRLTALNYPGWVCLEYVWIDWEGCNRCDNLSETILLREIFQNT